MKKILALAAIALFMVSCSDEDTTSNDNSNNNGSDVVLVKKMIDVISGEAQTFTLTYDGNKLLSIVSDYGTHTDFTYANGLLVKEEAFDGTETVNKILYQYDANNKFVSCIESSLYDGTFYTRKNVYTYNNNGTINVTKYSGDENAQTHLDGTGIVTLTNGNITRYSFTSSDGSTPSETITSTFDDKNDPFKNVFANDIMNLAFLGGGNNNTLTQKTPNDDLYTVSEYIYNDGGYPTKETTYWSGSLAYETQYFYE